MATLNRWTLVFAALLVVATPLTLPANAAQSLNEYVLHNFQPNTGNFAQGNLIFDASGNLYGTTFYGGTGCDGLGCGLVFELSPGVGGQWSETVLHYFQGPDGADPAAGLTLDAAGNLYGTTEYGGKYGSGTVFELTPGTNGQWNEAVLHSFGLFYNGDIPFAGVIFDAVGNLYGTTYGGGINNKTCSTYASGGCGVVFKLTPGANGKWTETVLFRFGGPDGSNPATGLTLDAAGNLYGTTALGGIFNYYCPSGCGTAFKLTPRKLTSRQNEWAETVMYKFTGGTPTTQGDGEDPASSLIADASGNWYGTTWDGGDLNCQSTGCGLVFMLTQSGSGTWEKTDLYVFSTNSEGEDPGQLTLDASGNLYGPLSFGGGGGRGVIFKLTPGENGGWTYTALWSFNGTDGLGPNGVVLDSQGNLYGTTIAGGNGGCLGGCGVVFELTP